MILKLAIDQTTNKRIAYVKRFNGIEAKREREIVIEVNEVYIHF